jgi:hypothetical protein
MAGKKVSALPVVTTLAQTDEIVVLVNPGGSPVNNTIALQNFSNQIDYLTGVQDYVNSAQQVRTTATFTKTSDVTLANVPGLSVNLATGGHYRITARLHFTASSSGGVKAALSGTVVPSNIIYNGFTYYAAVTASNQATALNTAVGMATSATTGMMEITGEIDVTTGGTLTVQFAQNASFGTGSVVMVGSSLFVDRMN